MQNETVASCLCRAADEEDSHKELASVKEEVVETIIDDGAVKTVRPPRKQELWRHTIFVIFLLIELMTSVDVRTFFEFRGMP